MVMLRSRTTGKIINVDEKDLGKYRVAPPQPQPQLQPQVQERGGNLLTALLPLIGSLAGGALGAPLGPIGLIGGSAVGSGLGEFGRQTLSGGDISGKKILGETVLGGLAGGAGALLGGAAKAARGVQAGENVAVKAGAKFAAKPYTSEAIKRMAGKNIKNVASKATEIGETITSLAGGTAPSKLTSLGKNRESLNTLLGNITKNQLGKTPVAGNALLNTVKSEAAASAVDLSSGAGKTTIKFWGPKIGKVKTLEELSTLNQRILNKISDVGVKTQQGQILKAIQSPLTAELNSLSGTGDVFAALSRLNAAEPILASQAGKSYRLFGLESNIPTRLQEYLQSAGGSAFGKAGQFAVSPLGRQAGGQLGTRALMGGGWGETQIPTDYQTEQVAPTTTGYEQPKPKLNITAEQVAMARLLLPDKQADALEAAYNIMNKKSTASASQEFIDKATTNIQTLENTKTLGYGPAVGRAYELQLGVLGGAGTPPEAVALNQRYNLLKLNILRAYQGARISDKDFELARLYIPSVSDTDATARTKLKILNDLLLSAQPPAQTEMTYQTD